jgi:hypothetical protein
MKISDQFILRNIAGDNLLIPTGPSALDVKGLILLSESGMLLYSKLKDGCTKEDLVSALTAEYEVSAQEAARDMEAFLEQLRQLHILLED